MSKRIDRQVTREKIPSLQRKIVWRWLLVLGYAVCIFTVSAIPGHALPRLNVSDKLLHAAEFGVLTFLFCRALRAHLPAYSHRAIMIISILMTISYGITDEVHQSLVAQRVTDLADLAADSCGALLAALGWSQTGKHWTWLQ